MSIEIVWSALSRTRLREIRAYVAQDKPQAAERLALRLVTLVESLRHQPYLGRPGRVAGTRELVFGDVPYIVIYRVAGKQVWIETIVHGAQLK